QKEILAPLAAEWDKIEDKRKLKWLVIARRYPAMTSEEQQRVQTRMRDWASLTPDQRRQAREQYKNLQKIPPEKRDALIQKWQEYDSLPGEEKQRLNEIAPKPPVPRKAVAPLPKSTELPAAP